MAQSKAHLQQLQAEAERILTRMHALAHSNRFSRHGKDFKDAAATIEKLTKAIF
jgi:hypothetical protein